MNIRTIVNEPRRGCGYRKAGGLYLIAGKPSAPCGKLPLPLEVCPVCGQGIKPARGWTWVNGRGLFGGVNCKEAGMHSPNMASMHCVCVLDEPPERMGLLWIGEKFYATPEDFLKEGMAQGVSRRISAIPRDFEIGKTWVLFAHRKVIKQPEWENVPDAWTPAIFACFLPTSIEYALKGTETEEELDRMEERGISLVRLVRTDDGNGNGVLQLKEEPILA